MKLAELLKNIKPIQIIGDADIEIQGVQIDSRKIKNGFLFIAEKGTLVDGHRFISKAIASGAIAILCIDLPEEIPTGVTFIQVADTEDAVGKVTTLFYGDPSRHLTLVGVTGTNGKTTTAGLFAHRLLTRKLGGPLSSRSQAKPSGARRSVSRSRQPASSGVMEGRAMSCSVSCRVGDIGWAVEGPACGPTGAVRQA